MGSPADVAFVTGLPELKEACESCPPDIHKSRCLSSSVPVTKPGDLDLDLLRRHPHVALRELKIILLLPTSIRGIFLAQLGELTM